MTENFQTAYMLNFKEVPDPFPGNLTDLAQTGDIWWLVVLFLICLVTLAIVGIFVSKKMSKTAIGFGEAILSKKGIIIVVSSLILICCSVCVFITNKAIAEENHIDPSYEDFAIPLTANVGSPSGKISVDTFKLTNLNPAPLPEDADLLNISQINVYAGNECEDIQGHFKISDITVSQVLFDGYLNSSDVLVHSIGLNDDIKIEVTDLNPEDTKKIIDKKGCLIEIGGTALSRSEYSDTTHVDINLNSDNVKYSEKAKEILKNKEWKQGSVGSENVWTKSFDAGTKTQEVISIFNELIASNDITNEGKNVAGWVDDTRCLCPILPYKDPGSPWTISCNWTTNPIEKIDYVLSLSDGYTIYELTDIGQNVLNTHSEWQYDSATQTLTCKNVSINQKPQDVISIWKSDTVQVVDSGSNAHFNYWAYSNGALITNNLPLWSLEDGKLNLCIISWFEEELVNDKGADVDAAASEASVAEEAAVAEEAVVESVPANEDVAVEASPVVDQIIDHVTEELSEVVTPLVLMLLWFL